MPETTIKCWSQYYNSSTNYSKKIKCFMILWIENNLSTQTSYLVYNTWCFSAQFVSARLQCFLDMFNSAVVVHKAHKPKFMVVNGDNLYKLFRHVGFACGWVHCSQLMQWNDHLMHKIKRFYDWKYFQTIEKLWLEMVTWWEYFTSSKDFNGSRLKLRAYNAA
jgi:hypothetical protein